MPISPNKGFGVGAFESHPAQVTFRNVRVVPILGSLVCVFPNLRVAVGLFAKFIDHDMFLLEFCQYLFGVPSFS